ncbi:MAG: hypothetical protein RL373_593 [Pseudomonadota bacterium]|jgi:CrcB protein
MSWIGLNSKGGGVMWQSIAAISLGASLGAVLRWTFGILLNPMYSAIPLGTVCANLLGGYLIGLALAVFEQHAEIAPEWRLLIITGFLGGLTTFSTFSAEVTKMLHDGSFAVAFGTILIHVVGSIMLTILGIYTYQFFK